MQRFATLTCAITATLAVALACGPANAANYPVPYTLEPSSALQPNVPPVGTNHWSCKPTTRHPYPVILVNGTFANMADNWTTYGPLLANEGYCVFTFNYGAVDPLNEVGGLRSIESSALTIRVFVNRVLAATGARKVDIVGHSQGTLDPDYYAKFLGGAAHIARYVSLAPLWHGTNVAGLGTITALVSALGFGSLSAAALDTACVACREFLPGSALLTRMRASGGPAVPGIAYTNIVTKYDELVSPYTSGIEAKMTNVVIQDGCPTDRADHLALVYDRRTAVAVLNALDPLHHRPLPCTTTLPLLGSG